MRLVNILAESTITRNFCNEPGVTNVIYLLGVLIFAIKIIIPIGMIILGSVDMAKAVLANDDTAIKKNALALARRLAIGVLIFFIPTIVNFALGLVYNFNDDFQNTMKNCSNCLLNPTSYEGTNKSGKINIADTTIIKDKVNSGKCVRTEESYSDEITCSSYLKGAQRSYNGELYEYNKEKAETSIKGCRKENSDNYNEECIIKTCFTKIKRTPIKSNSSNSGKSTGSFIWPVPDSSSVSGWYGSYSGHQGNDIAAPIGTRVVAADGGEVVIINNNCEPMIANSSCGDGWGNYIRIKHNDTYSTQYNHLSAITVKVGDKVNQGDIIGAVGNSGNSTGPHLDFEIWKNGSRISAYGLIEYGKTTKYN